MYMHTHIYVYTYVYMWMFCLNVTNAFSFFSTSDMYS